MIPKRVFAPKRLITAFVLSSLLSFLVLPALLQQNVLAASGDETTTGSIVLTPTIECIGAIVTYTGDNNDNNSIILEYRQAGTGTWLTAPEMYRDDYRSYLGTDSEFRGSIFWLTTNTTYEVRATIHDPDGVTGTNPLIGNVTTRNDNPPSNGNSYYVSASGNDSNNGSIGSPWLTLAHAVEQVSAGDTIYIRGGTYYLSDPVGIYADGTATNYITLCNYSGETVILDGQGLVAQQILYLHAANYWRIKGIQFQNTRTSLVRVSESDGVVIEGCTFIDPNHAQGGTRGAIRLDYDTSNSLIQNNTIIVNEGGQRITYGIVAWEAGDGHVIRYNHISSTTAALNDGAGFFPEDNYTYNSNIDVYGNVFRGGADDGVQIEAAGVNCRIWNNRIEDFLIGFAVCPVKLGPTYIFRNVLVDSHSHTDHGPAFAKLGDGSIGRIYFYHNTFWADGSGVNGLSQTNHGVANIVSRNNVYRAGRYIIEMPTIYAEYEQPDFDYDLIYTSTTTGRFIEWIRAYGSLTEFQSSTGQYMNAIHGEATFANLAARDMRLAEGSTGIDSGVILPGFNDANSPWPYSGAAPDIGAYEYGSGGPTNYPPVLGTIGNKSVNAEGTLRFTVSATDPNGDALTYSASNLPQGATFNPQTRTFSWTPSYSQVGSYPNIRFSVSDSALTDFENIAITVRSGINEPPVLSTIGNKSVGEGELLQFTVSATDPDGDALTYSATNLPQGATFNSQTRTFSWRPALGQRGSYLNVHFEVSDGELTDFENITITVTSDGGSSPLLRVNAGGNAYTDTQGNKWEADRAYTSGSWGFYGTDNTVDRGTSHAISGTADDRIYQTERYGLSGYRFDLDNGTYTVTLHFAETYRTGPGQRVFDVAIEGQLVLDNLDIYSEVGYSTALKKTLNGIVVQDGQLNIVFTKSIEQPEINGIEITAASGGNRAPTLNPIGNRSVREGKLLQFTISAIDQDGDTLTYSASNLPAGATFNPIIRTFSWTPASSQVGYYPNVHFEVSDGELTDFENITITVLSSDNSAPVLDTIGNKSVREGEELEFTISATDPDSDPLTFSASNLPDGATFNAQTTAFSWTPELGQRGSYFNVRFNVTDGDLLDFEYITITVIPNDPPLLNTIGNKSVREGEELEFTISATDPNGDGLTYSAYNLPQGANFNPETRTFSWTPNFSDIGTHNNVHFEVTDGAWTDTEDITITVLISDNSAPVFDTIGNKSVNEEELLEFIVSATDPDDDPLTFSASGLPQGATFDPETGTFSWTPQTGDADNYENIHFEVSDGERADSEDITITVNIPTPPAGGGGGGTGGAEAGGGGGGGVGGDFMPYDNTAPVLNAIGNKSVNEGEPIEFTVSASDPNNDPLTFSASGLPQGATFDSETRTFSWTPGPDTAGTHASIDFEVSDGKLTDSESITITVGNTTADNTQQDDAPPVIQVVAASEATKDSVEIRWTTTEPSTSQVEYWASPSKFSPLDETLVTEHVVRLTDLTPGTDYHYRTLSQDEAGNLATSPEYSFITPGNPATFAVRWLSISPAEADIGEEVTISVLVTNTGDISGSYDITLSIDDTVEATESVIDLAGGGSQEVAFNITCETAGEYTVSVNSATGSLLVREADLFEPTITVFKIRPIYEADTGVIAFTSIDCQMNESYHSTLFSQLGAELVLKVALDDEPLEEVILISSEQSEPAMSIDGLNYAPADGWTAGIYTFQAELRTGDGVVETLPAEELVITAAAAAAVVSWATLGEIIGGVLIIALFVMLFILHRSRDMLRAYA